MTPAPAGDRDHAPNLCRIRRRVLVVLLLLALTAPAAASTRTAPPDGAAYVATAVVSVKRLDGKGKIHLFLIATRNVTGTEHPAQLLVVGRNCVRDRALPTVGAVLLGVALDDGCTDAGRTVTPLSPSMLRIDPELRSARLTTTWLGRPLTVQWNAARQPSHRSDVEIAAGHQRIVMLNSTSQQATATTVALGQNRPCAPDTVASLTTADRAARSVPDTATNPAPSSLADVDELKQRRVDCGTRSP